MQHGFTLPFKQSENSGSWAMQQLTGSSVLEKNLLSSGGNYGQNTLKCAYLMLRSYMQEAQK